MTGLVAVFDPRGDDPSLADLIARLPTHASRSEEWHDQFCAMAHLHHGALETTPQPTFNNARSLGLLVDGYVHEASGHHGGSELPTAARLLKAYELGANGLANTKGSFAAVIYDRVGRRINLVSDRLGTRPLYYFRTGSCLVVASHVAALTAHPRCPKQIDRGTIHQVLAYEQVIGDGTIYRGVHRLEPGAILSFDGETLELRRYWTMRWPQPFSSKEEAGAALAEQVREAVARSVDGSQRPGLLLSGGFDSRLILAAAERPLLCLTQAASRNREVEVAERVARAVGAEFRFVQVDPIRYSELFDEAVRLTGGVQNAQACHWLPELKQISEWCDVLLNGWAFNTIYRGYYLPTRTVRVAGYSARAPQLLELGSDDPIQLVVRNQKNQVRWASLAQILSDKARAEHDAVLEDAIRDGLRGFDGNSPSSVYNAWDYLGLHAIGRHAYYGNVLSIRSWMDDRTIALDFDLVDTALRLRPEWRMPDVVYRLALRQVLPRSLAALPHAGTGLRPSVGATLAFPIVNLKRALRKAHTWPRSTSVHPLGTRNSWPDFGALLRHHGPMRDRLTSLPDSEALHACGMFDQRGLRKLVDAHLEGAQSSTKLLLLLLMLDSWLCQFGGLPDNRSEPRKTEVVRRPRRD